MPEPTTTADVDQVFESDSFYIVARKIVRLTNRLAGLDIVELERRLNWLEQRVAILEHELGEPDA